MTDENQMKIEKKRRKIKTILGTITIIGGVGLFTYGIKEYKENNEFTRIVTEDGNYELEGYISYDNLSSYKLVEIKTITGENRIYITKMSKYNAKITYHIDYIDIYSNEIIGSEGTYIENSNIISVNNMKDFLIAYEMIKAKYSEDDIEYLLNRIKDDYYNNENLKLVKTKSE